MDAKAKTCCTPSRAGKSERQVETPPLKVGETCVVQDAVTVPKGSALIGTKTPLIPNDGEGPLRRKAVRSFQMAATTITNATFARFVKKAKGLSGQSGGAVLRGQIGVIFTGLIRRIWRYRIILSCRCRGVMLMPLPSGAGGVCPRKPNGNMPHVADWAMCVSRGVTRNPMMTPHSPATSGRDNFRKTTPLRMDGPTPHLRCRSHRMATGCTIWSAMSGNGQPTRFA